MWADNSELFSSNLFHCWMWKLVIGESRPNLIFSLPPNSCGIRTTKKPNHFVGLYNTRTTEIEDFETIRQDSAHTYRIIIIRQFIWRRNMSVKSPQGRRTTYASPIRPKLMKLKVQNTTVKYDCKKIILILFYDTFWGILYWNTEYPSRNWKCVRNASGEAGDGGSLEDL